MKTTGSAPLMHNTSELGARQPESDTGEPTRKIALARQDSDSPGNNTPRPTRTAQPPLPISTPAVLKESTNAPAEDAGLLPIAAGAPQAASASPIAPQMASSAGAESADPQATTGDTNSLEHKEVQDPAFEVSDETKQTFDLMHKYRQERLELMKSFRL